MNLDKFIKKCHKFSKPYRVENGEKFQLHDFDPEDIGDFSEDDKPRAQEALSRGVEALADLQERLYAQDKWAVLFIFQAMDAAGKDGAIKHVMSGINPQGCQVSSFKKPSELELDHDYMWRCLKEMPERGRIGIFNRSYYEEVLVTRVHPEILRNQKLPLSIKNEDIWKERYEDIRNIERYLSRNGVLIRKFFLHLSKKEQKKRFLSRLEDPDKNWKFSGADFKERQYWDDYQEAYEKMIRHTATEEAPWYVIPADHKWYTRILVGATMIDALGSLNLEFPKVLPQNKRENEKIRKQLLSGSAPKVTKKD